MRHHKESPKTSNVDLSLVWHDAAMAPEGKELLLGAADGASPLVAAAAGLPLWLPLFLCLCLTWLSAISSAKSVVRVASSAFELLERGLRGWMGASLSVWLGHRLLRRLFRALRRRRARTTRRTRSYGSTGALQAAELDAGVPKPCDASLPTRLG